MSGISSLVSVGASSSSSSVKILWEQAMEHGLYDLFGLTPDAPTQRIREAYQRRLAELVRRRRTAQQHGAETFILELRQLELREAMEILSDPARRRRYDAFRSACRDGIPEDVDALWEQSRRFVSDPLVPSAVAAVRTLTDLPVGSIHPEPAPRRPSRQPATRSAAPQPTPRPSEPAPPQPRPARLDEPAAPPRPSRAEGEVSTGAAPPSSTTAPRATDANARQPVWTQQSILPSSSAPAQRIQAVPTDPSTAGREPRSPSYADVDVASPPASPPEPSYPPEPRDEIDALIQRTGFDGEFVRSVRELREMALADLSRATRISKRYLSAIENNEFSRLPTATFVRGYIKQIVEVLDIGGRGVLEGYMALYRERRD